MTRAAMRAVRLHAPREGQRREDLRVEEAPAPEPAAGEVLVEVAASGIDEDDLDLTRGITTSGAGLPVTLGGEAVGRIVEVGAGAEDWQPGDRVVVVGTSPCGRCPPCLAGSDHLCVALDALGRDRDGTHADHVVADARHVLPAPVEVADETAAIVARSVALPYHACKRAGVVEDVVVAVHGLGGRALHAILLAQLAGAHVIAVGSGASRLERARAWGADEVVDAATGDVAGRLRELSEGGVDRSIELAGDPDAVEHAVAGLRPGGRAAVTLTGGWSLRAETSRAVVADELDVVGARRPSVSDVGEVLDLLADGRLDLGRSVTHRVGLDEVPGALRRLEDDEDEPVRIVALPG